MYDILASVSFDSRGRIAYFAKPQGGQITHSSVDSLSIFMYFLVSYTKSLYNNQRVSLITGGTIFCP